MHPDTSDNDQHNLTKSSANKRLV